MAVSFSIFAVLSMFWNSSCLCNLSCSNLWVCKANSLSNVFIRREHSLCLSTNVNSICFSNIASRFVFSVCHLAVSACRRRSSAWAFSLSATNLLYSNAALSRLVAALSRSVAALSCSISFSASKCSFSACLFAIRSPRNFCCLLAKCFNYVLSAIHSDLLNLMNSWKVDMSVVCRWWKYYNPNNGNGKKAPQMMDSTRLAYEKYTLTCLTIKWQDMCLEKNMLGWDFKVWP